MMEGVKVVKPQARRWIEIERHIYTMQAQHWLPGVWIRSYRRDSNQVLGHRRLIAGIDPPVVPAKGEEATRGAGRPGNQVGVADGKGVLELIFPTTLAAEVYALVSVDIVVAVQKGEVHMAGSRRPLLEINCATAIDGVIHVKEGHVRLGICAHARGQGVAAAQVDQCGDGIVRILNNSRERVGICGRIGGQGVIQIHPHALGRSKLSDLGDGSELACSVTTWAMAKDVKFKLLKGLGSAGRRVRRLLERAFHHLYPRGMPPPAPG